MKSKKKQSFAQGVFILLISQIFIKILGLIYRLYLTNKEGFGDAGNAIYSSGFQIYAILLTISSVGVPNAVSNLISEKLSIGDEKNAKRIFRVSLAIFGTIGCACSILLFAGAEYISNYVLMIPESKLTLQVLAPSIFFVSMMSVFRGYFNARRDMNPMAFSQTIEQVTKTVFTIIIVEYIFIHMRTNNHKTEFMAAGANLATSIATIISYCYLQQRYRKYKTEKITNNKYQLEAIRKVLKKIFIVAMPITASALIVGLSKTIDSVTVVRGLKKFMSTENAKVQYGILSGKIDTLVTLPMSFNMALTANLVPAISSARASNCMKQVIRKIKLSVLVTMLIALPCTALMVMYASQILKLLFPKAYGGYFIFQISAISIIFVMTNQTINAVLQGIGKHFMPVISIGIGIIAKLILNIILIPINPEKFVFGGLAGAALGTVACYMIALFINFLKLKKSLKFKFTEYKFLIKPVIATIMMSILSKLIYYTINNKFNINSNILTIIILVISILIYFILILCFKCFQNQKKEIN